MDARWLDCFRDGCTFVPADGSGETREGRLTAGGAVVGAVHDSVIDLTGCADVWDPDLEELERNGVIEQNWKYANGMRDSGIAREIAAVDGPICEVAAGPGGGFMPRVRQLNPRARILINDLSRGVLALWSRFLSAQGLDGGLCFAAFDATRPALRPGCLAAVSSLGGFSNIAPAEVIPHLDAVRRGDVAAAQVIPTDMVPPAEAIRRMADALRSGGLLFAQEMTLDPAAWAHLAPALRDEWEQRWAPWLSFSLLQAVTAAGLQVVRHEASPGRTIEPEDGEAAQDAARYGITLRTRGEYVQAVKP